MVIDTTKKVKKIMVDGALMPFSSAIDANIQPENIKKDVTILGITGSLNTNIPQEISTEQEMNGLLVIDNLGKAYKFTGESTANYINGDIYIVEGN